MAISGSREDFARLGIYIDANGAITTTKELTGHLKLLGQEGEKAARTVTRGTNDLRAAMARMRMESAKRLDLGLAAQIKELDPFQKGLRAIPPAASSAHVSMGRLKNSLEAVTTAALGAAPVFGRLGGVVGEMAFGGKLMTGVLLGTAALVIAYDKITEGARKATEEQKKLTQALADRFAPQTGTGSAVNTEYTGALAQQADANRRLRLLMGASNDMGVQKAFREAGLSVPFRNREDEIAFQTERLRQANVAIGRARANGAGVLPTVSVTGGGGGGGGDASAQIARYNDFMARTYFDATVNSPTRAQRADWLSTMHRRDMGGTAFTNAAYYMALSDINGRIPNGAGAVGGIVAGMGFDAEGRSGFLDAGLKKSQLDVRDKMGILVNDGNKNAQKLHDAIWGSAAQLGNVLVSALNIGGGGKGSNIGGAIGSTAGFAIGYTVGGPVGGAIGSTIGNIAGSFFGGLFDHHKKSVDKNTDALNALTAALYNAPSGYKVAGARYRADDGRYVYASGSSESYYRSLRGGYGGMGMAA